MSRVAIRPDLCARKAIDKDGSPGRTRTSDPAVNSRLLYQLSYRGSEALPSGIASLLDAERGIVSLYTGLRSRRGGSPENPKTAIRLNFDSPAAKSSLN